jgi:peptidoglycan/xylan/chitin deacetylase (PgdA/CDA1 family)
VISLTFDNLGEVTALARGQWPEGEPLGRHHSVTRALPRILELLDETGLRATFFVEGLNAELYPDTLRALDAAGHEVAYHGWCHEPWASLDAGAERKLLERGVERLGALGLTPTGFRPPGGELTPRSLSTLAELGFTYCSPAGERVERGSVAVLPFRWELVDAFHYLPHFGDLRGSAEPHPPERLRRAIAEAGDHAVLVFHPFLLDDDERFAVLRDALARVRGVPLRELV